MLLLCKYSQVCLHPSWHASLSWRETPLLWPSQHPEMSNSGNLQPARLVFGDRAPIYRTSCTHFPGSVDSQKQRYSILLGLPFNFLILISIITHFTSPEPQLLPQNGKEDRAA